MNCPLEDESLSLGLVVIRQLLVHWWQVCFAADVCKAEKDIQRVIAIVCQRLLACSSEGPGHLGFLAGEPLFVGQSCEALVHHGGGVPDDSCGTWQQQLEWARLGGPKEVPPYGQADQPPVVSLPGEASQARASTRLLGPRLVGPRALLGRQLEV
eukprot:scaffold1497_cov122-Cylindrotheca_fusiformis.AAC.4